MPKHRPKNQNQRSAQSGRPGGATLVDRIAQQSVSETEDLKQKLASLEASIEQARAEAVAEVHANIAALRDEAFQEEREALRIAREELATEAAAQRRALEIDAERRLEEVLRQARAESTDLLRVAERQADGIRAKAESEAQAALDSERRRIEAREMEVEAAKAMLGTERRELRQLQDDYEANKVELEYDRTRLQKRWDECRPGQVLALQQEVETAKAIETALRTTVESLREELTRSQALLIRLDGMSAEEVVAALERAFDERKDIETRLAAIKVDHEAQYADLERRLEEAHADNEALRIARADAEARAVRLQNGVQEVAVAKLEHDSLRAQNEYLETLVRKDIEAYRRMNKARFPGLLAIDEAKAVQEPLRKEVSLPGIVSGFVQYAASRATPFFYSEDQVRIFIAGLAASPLLILQGLSGTGKTSLPRLFAEYLGGENPIVPVQSSWRDRNELLGYHNDFNERFRETDFTKAVYEGGTEANKDRLWIVTLDEMNLSRIEYYFSDFVSGLEQKRDLERENKRMTVALVEADLMREGETSPRYLEQGHRLVVGPNVWFVGTANRDESTFEITDKVYDRAQVMEFDRRQSGTPTVSTDPLRTSSAALRRAFEAAIKRSENKLSDEEAFYLDQLDEDLILGCGVSFGNRIKDQIDRFVPVFAASGGNKGGAVDHQVATKVLRKFDGPLEADVRKGLARFADRLQQAPDGWDMQRCAARVARALGTDRR